MGKLDEGVVVLWGDDLYTLQMIADLYGVSRQGVKKFLNRRGIDTGYRKLVVVCDGCGVEFEKSRCHVRKNRFNYCSLVCYVESMEKPDYNVNRQGQRDARRLVKSMFPLEPDHVVHHKDGDTTNNDVDNLLVFANHSDHMRWHRGDRGLVSPLWPPNMIKTEGIATTSPDPIEKARGDLGKLVGYEKPFVPMPKGNKKGKK